MANKLGIIVSSIGLMDSRTKTNSNQKASNTRKKNLSFVDFVVQEVIQRRSYINQTCQFVYDEASNAVQSCLTITQKQQIYTTYDNSYAGRDNLSHRQTNESPSILRRQIAKTQNNPTSHCKQHTRPVILHHIILEAIFNRYHSSLIKPKL